MKKFKTSTKIDVNIKCVIATLFCLPYVPFYLLECIFGWLQDFIWKHLPDNHKRFVIKLSQKINNFID